MVQIGDRRLPSRFWNKVQLAPCELLPTECWQWTASLTRKGYAQFYVGSKKDGTNRMATAHVLSYKTLVGPVPDGKQLDHLCRNRGCVNPQHLEPVTGSVNCLRGLTGINVVSRERAKTHCPQGHPYDETNTLFGKNGSRQCRTCARERMQRSVCPKCGGQKSVNKEICRQCYLESVRLKE